MHATVGEGTQDWNTDGIQVFPATYPMATAELTYPLENDKEDSADYSGTTEINNSTGSPAAESQEAPTTASPAAESQEAPTAESGVAKALRSICNPFRWTRNGYYHREKYTQNGCQAGSQDFADITTLKVRSNYPSELPLLFAAPMADHLLLRYLAEKTKALRNEKEQADYDSGGNLTMNGKVASGPDADSIVVPGGSGASTASDRAHAIDCVAPPDMTNANFGWEMEVRDSNSADHVNADSMESSNPREFSLVRTYTVGLDQLFGEGSEDEIRPEIWKAIEDGEYHELLVQVDLRPFRPEKMANAHFNETLLKDL